MRRTKIISTIGPACDSTEMLNELIESGTNLFRLNFSHGSHQEKSTIISRIKALSKTINKPIPIIADIQGPKVRVRPFKDGYIVLEENQTVRISGSEAVENVDIVVDYPHFVDDISEKHHILLDDGNLEMVIQQIAPDRSYATAEVVIGGKLLSNKGVNLPNTHLSIKILTEKDKEDLIFCAKHNINIIAISFIRNAQDIIDIKNFYSAHSETMPWFISKVEVHEAVENIEDIIAHSNGVMIARGDLGVELPAEKIPLIQKSIIKKCRHGGIPVITATQMMESVIHKPRPTRAECTDVANAILDGTDALMLSAETSVGKYPTKAVSIMSSICQEIEKNTHHLEKSLNYIAPELEEKRVIESLCYMCNELIKKVNAVAISAISHSGTTARRIAKYRPSVPIYVFTHGAHLLEKLTLVWGVEAIGLKSTLNTDSSIELMERYLYEHDIVKKEDKIIMMAGMPVSARFHTNMIKISTINE